MDSDHLPVTTAIVTKEEILQMQNNTPLNNTKETTKLEMKVLRGKKCFNI